LFRAATEFIKPKSFAGKFMVNIWACFCMAFMASYTANLAAFMITKEEYYELKGIEDDRVKFLNICLFNLILFNLNL
jgi:glutamate receptor ionotropic, NMDA 2B